MTPPAPKPPAAPLLTLAFWKPYDVLSKFTDADGRATLADYIDLQSTQHGARPTDLYGAGRLDRDSEGLLILSQDRALRTILTEPRHAIARTYWAQVEGIPSNSALQDLRDGVTIKGHRTAPAAVRLFEEPPDVPDRSVPIRVRKTVPDRWIELEVSEGKNRQIRRMTAAVGHPTLRLLRVKVGPITLDGLEPGQWRRLSSTETTQLRQTSPSESRWDSRRRPSRRSRRRGASR